MTYSICKLLTYDIYLCYWHLSISVPLPMPNILYMCAGVNGQGAAQLGNQSHTWYRTHTLAHMAFHTLDSDFLSWMANMGVSGQLVLLR